MLNNEVQVVDEQIVLLHLAVFPLDLPVSFIFLLIHGHPDPRDHGVHAVQIQKQLA